MKFLVKAARLGAFILGAALLSGLIGAAVIQFYLIPQLPSPETLRDVRYQVPLRIYTADGKLVAEYGEMRRIPVKLDGVPDLMVKAVLAAEDDRFFHHPGVDYQGLMRAAWVLTTTGQKTQGGSTITMQVARNFFLGREKTYLRKINEILLAFKIERELSKQEILELYLNKIYLGQRAYGIAAAAQVYYGKELPQLTVAEMAMIAGLPKAPSRYNPVADPARALARRNYILGRMHELGYITDAVYRTAEKERDTASVHTLPVEAEALYLAEMARAEVLQRYGEEEAYTSGIKVYTSLDSRLQSAANRSLRDALLEYDRRHGYRGAEAHVALPAAAGVEEWRAALADYYPIGGLVPALVVKIGGTEIGVALKDGRHLQVPWDAMRWAHRQVNENATGSAPATPADVVKLGDIVRLDLSHQNQVRFTQLPQVEGALVGLRPSDGAVVALVGGFDFFRSKFNRVVQAARQPGSAFKPFVYSAALEHGMTPATVVNDAPVVFDDPDLEDAWRPENYSGRFYGPTRLREALTHSRNLVSIRVLRAIGINDTVDYASRFGFDKQALPRNLSLALGSGVTTPLNLASAYAVFANSGYRVTPYFMQRIEDAEGNVLWQAQPANVCSTCSSDAPGAAATDNAALPAAALTGTVQRTPSSAQPPRVISAQNAYLMTSMMKDVIRRGTGQQARELGRNDIAGKTGTTNDQRDAWFAGYSPAMVAVAWVGFDDTHPLGNAETGGRAALPMWINFMRAALAGVPDQPPEQPPGLVTVRINPESGLLAAPGDQNAIFETFFAENAPTKLAAGHAPAADGAAPNSSAPAIPEQLF